MSDPIVPSGWRDRLDDLAGKRRDLWPVVVLLVLVLTVVLALRLRDPAPQIAPPATEPPPALTPQATPSPVGLFVHVAGAVRQPGLYTLPPGSRVADAVEAAGGPLPRAEIDAVNLAEQIVDGSKIEVPRRGDAVTAVAGELPSASTPAPSVIDLNSADVTQLETIPGIGPVRAAAIVQHRDENGPFASVDALLDVSGIGPATLESMRAYVTV